MATPDISSILNSLITYSPHPPTSQQPQQASAPEDDSEYDPSQFNPALLPSLPSAQKPEVPQDLQAQYPDLVDPPPNQAGGQKDNPAKSTPKRPPLAKTITTYASALRHITTRLLPSPSFAPRIRHLMQTQHKHEREWYEGREKLVKQLENRDASRKKLDEVLASVGGRPATPTSSSGDTATGELGKLEELRVYDRKVWRAQKEMIEAAAKELERLGVPFFGEAASRVWKANEEELRELQRKVITLLEDLCGSDEDNDKN